MTTGTIFIAPGRLPRGLLYSGSLAVVWLIAAVLRPEVTYHLAPVLVAGSLPIALVLDRDHVPKTRALVLAAGLGFAVAVATTALLAGAGWLEGPTLGPFKTAAGESLAGAAFGAVTGLLTAILWRR
jgi:hypothetical protein